MRTNIIVIENSRDGLEAISTVLGQIGCKVFGFFDGHEIIEKVRAINPDLIIINVKLGNEDGRQLCRQIKATEDISHLPVLMMAGKLQDAIIRECEAEGFLPRPFATRQLNELINIHRLSQ